jgi:uncharacterized protein with HEPN domain
MLLDSDRTRLQHMLDAAREAVGYVRDIDLDIVWVTASQELPDLMKDLEGVLSRP